MPRELVRHTRWEFVKIDTRCPSADQSGFPRRRRARAGRGELRGGDEDLGGPSLSRRVPDDVRAAASTGRLRGHVRLPVLEPLRRRRKLRRELAAEIRATMSGCALVWVGAGGAAVC